jgi:Arc-like DNA binding domain
MARKPTDTVQLKLRFPEAVRRRLEREAARNARSMNTEIIHRLQRTFAIDDGAAATNMLDVLRSLGVDITRANERDVAVALQNIFGRILTASLLAPPAAAAPVTPIQPPVPMKGVNKVEDRGDRQ